MHVANAQLCQGSLGDPIVNITFGHGNNPGPASSAATTTYQYIGNDCPNDGYYTIINSSNSCFGATWHNIPADHTGEAGGYFMLVNASIQPSAFYVDTVKGLCSSTTYELAAWIINVIKASACNGGSIQPNLTFSVEKTDGTVLKTYNTGSIPPSNSPAWNQYGTFFTTPAGVSDVVLRIFNNSQGGCGNDLALDDITFRPCGPVISNLINGSPAVTINLCQSATLTQYTLTCNVSSGFTNPTYVWQFSTPSATDWYDAPMFTTNSVGFVLAPNAPSGVYKARLAVAEAGNLSTPKCRVYSNPFIFLVHDNPVTTATNNGPVCENTILNLAATGGLQYTWAGPNSYSATGPMVSITNVQASQAGKYYVTVTNDVGCTHLDSTTVVVNPAPLAVTGFASLSICIEDSAQLSASGGLGYQWIPPTGLSDPGLSNPKASPAVTTAYNVIVSNQYNCKDTAESIITIIPKPVANAGPDKAILQGQLIQLQGSINGPGNSITWSPANFIDDIHILQPFVNPVSDTKYVLTAVSDLGCGSSTDTVFVKVYKNIYVPSAFSPNGDGKNDSWNIPALEAYPVFELSVFSRWGQLVFHTKNAFRTWDGTYKGKALPAGVYTYILDVGISQDLFKGTVMIIR